MAKQYNFVIWDWNGTLFNDLQASINATNFLLDEAALPLLTLEKYHENFRFPVKDYYRRLGFDFSVKSYEELAHEYIEHLLIENQKVTLHNNAYSILSELNRRGYNQLVLSASPRDILEERLTFFDIKQFFSEILALDDCFADGKIALANEWRTAHPAANVLLIGDTLHDADTAKAINADCLLFSNGHGNKNALLQTGFTVIDSLKEILNILPAKKI